MDPSRKRLLFRSHHCGMKENDLLLGRFADQYIERLDDAQFADYEHLMAQTDIDILNWITGKEPAPDDISSTLLDLIKNTNKL